MASLRSNVHPAAASDPLGTYGSPVPNSLMGGGGGDSGSPGRSLFASPITDAAVSSLMEGMSASDLSARARARGVLQSYARERQRVVELEAEIGKANNQLAQNDALISSLRKEVHDTAFSHSEEVRSLHTMRADVERRVAALEQELEDASAGFSRKLSEVMAQNRVKEQEVIHFETQLQRSNDESKRLRAELGRQLGYDDDGHEQDGSSSSPHQGGTRGIRAKELEAAQQRAVALAKKLIDAERGKREAEEALLEDRHHSQGALRTIENLRQQLADAHSRLTKEAGARRGDEQYYRGALEQMRNESEKQRQAYQEALLTAGERPLGGGASPAPAGGGTSARRGRSPSVNSSIVTSADDGGDGSSSASLRARLKAAGEQVAYLADQTDRRQQEIEALSEALAKERAGRIDDHTALSTAARDGKEELRRVKRDLVSVKAERSAAMRMIGDLKTLYERLLTPNNADASPVWSDEQLMVDVLYELRKIGTPLVVFERRGGEYDGSESDQESSIHPPIPASAVPVAAQPVVDGGDNVEERLRREMASLRSYHKKEVALMQEALKESQRGRVINALERATGIVTTPRKNTPATPPPQSVMPTLGSESGDALESENSRGGSVVEEAREWKEAFYHSEQVKRGLAQEVSQLRSEAARMRAFLKERDGRSSQLSPAYLDDHDEMVEGSPLSSHYPSPRKGAHRHSASPTRHTPRRRSSVESHNTNPHQDRSPSNRSAHNHQGVMGLVPSRNQVSAATERLLAEDAQASLKDHIATLHRYIIQLEQQAESDQSELERLRHRYHLLEMYHDAKFVQTKKEHAHEVQGLLRSLTEIREEYGDMMKRRQHLYNPTHTDADHSEDKHRYYHGTGGGTGLATGAEVALEKRLDALISSNERQLASSYRVTSGNGTPTSTAHHTAPPPPARSASPPLPTHYVTPTGVPASRTNSVASNPSYPPHHHTRESSSTTARSANSGGFVMRSP